MKQFLALVAILFNLTSAFANTVRVSNGGDLLNIYNPRVVSLMLAAPYQLRLMTHTWLKDGKFYLSSEKLVAFEKLIAVTPLRIQKEPCIVDGLHKAGAAYSGPQQSICMSWGLVEEQGDRDFPELQIIPLLAHEFFHLLEPTADERSACSFQLLVAKYLTENGIPAVNPGLTTKLNDNFVDSFDSIDWNDKVAVLKFIRGLTSQIQYDTEFLTRKQKSGYPVLTEENNVISDIEVRLFYMKMIAESNWDPDSHVHEMAEDLFGLQWTGRVRGGNRTLVKVADIERIFFRDLNFKVCHADAEVLYIKRNPSRQDFQILLADLKSYVDKLNQALDNMRLGSTPITFTLDE